MKFLIVEPSPLPMLILLRPKYSPQDPFSNALITVFIYFILTFKLFERIEEENDYNRF